MPGESTTETLLCGRQLVEKYTGKKKLCAVFIDSEKAHDGVPRGVLKRALMRRGIPKIYVDAIKDICVKIRRKYAWRNSGLYGKSRVGSVFVCFL